MIQVKNQIVVGDSRKFKGLTGSSNFSLLFLPKYNNLFFLWESTIGMVGWSWEFEWSGGFNDLVAPVICWQDEQVARWTGGKMND